MKPILSALFFLTIYTCNNAQVIVKGRVLDTEGQSLPGANVYIKNSYDGSTTNESGSFFFKTNLKGKQVLVASFIGYKNGESEIDLSTDSLFVTIRLNQASNQLRQVEIVAGTFEAGDAKRSASLKQLDIATTPSAVGDIYGALTTFPGSQIVGDKGGLYVRGGEGYETKTFFDGMQVARPYFSNIPDLPERGRFSPALFSGTLFSTGGFSAEYGQALSSALILNTTGIADKNQSSLAIMSVGINAAHTQRWKNSSLAVTGMYSDMSLYNSLFKQSIHWKKSPESADFTALYRIKTGKTGIWKIYAAVNANSCAMLYKDESSKNSESSMHLKNSDIYLNSVYSGQLPGKWRIRTGISFTKDNLRFLQDTFSVAQPVTAVNQRFTVTNELSDRITFKMGEEAGFYSYGVEYQLLNKDLVTSGIRMLNPALFAESEVRFSSKLALRAGLRTEYVSLIKNMSVVPRVSIAFKTSEKSQVSAAFGLFTQRPQDNYLLFNNKLNSEKAVHYILNYQFEKDNQILRIEAYHKNYRNLVKYTSENNPDPFAYNNNGKGYSSGLDLFWRDSKTIRNADYWVSYSFVQTKRDYKNYTGSMTPAYISPHTFSVVAKYMWIKTRTHWGINYTHASSKTWFSPGIPVTAQTKAYNDVSLNVIYLFIYFNINNIFGFRNVFGYNYELKPDGRNNYILNPIKPPSRRFFLVGLFLSFDKTH